MVDPWQWGHGRGEPKSFALRADAESYAQSIGLTPEHATPVTSKPAKWSDYSLDKGNPTYRETVLHLPGVEGDRAWMEMSKRIAEIGDQQYALGKEWPSATPERRADIDAEVQRITKERNDLVAKRSDHERSLPVFESGHWSEPNVIAHARTSIQKDTSGKPVFLINELQSDWGQKVRDGGARDEAKIAKLREEGQKASAERERTDQEMRDFVKANGIRVEYGRYDRAMTDAEMRNIPGAKELNKRWEKAASEEQRYESELRTALAATPSHPLVNTTDQWTTTVS